MWRFDGLPLHPLVVHAPVVLIPLVAAGLVLFGLRRTARPVLGPLLLVLALSAAIGAILSVETGQQLAETLRRGEELSAHEWRGELTRAISVMIAAGTALLVVLERALPDRRPRVVDAMTLAVAVVAIVGLVVAGLTGHSGAQLAWEAKLPAVSGATSSTAPPAPGASSDTTTLGSAPVTAPRPIPTADPVVEVVLGEWAIVVDAEAIPPGTVTFDIRNSGTRPHAFRVRTSGSGRDRLEWRSPTLDGGTGMRWTVALPAGTLELSCPIEDGAGDHDDLGMEALLSVRQDAPPITAAPPPTSAPPPGEAAGSASGGPVAVDIRAFSFEPSEIRVRSGTEVTWTNRDPAAHTATGDAFDTGVLAGGQGGSFVFDTAGSHTYWCTIHPAMTATVIVEA